MRTALKEKHEALGARIVDFAGWEMPVQYTGIIEEHHAVRQAVGVFDVSHMGLILVRGPDAERYLDYLSTNKIVGKKDGAATYTVWANPEGGCVDDVIVFREGPEAFYVVANAGNRDKDLAHIRQYSEGYDLEIEDRYSDHGILAVQGPKAEPLITEIFPEALGMRPMRCMQAQFAGQMMRLSTTGYTGSGGYELIVPNAVLPELWDLLMEKGAVHGIRPVGLGARDTLRLEMGFALYGHELSDDIFPTETVSAWTIRWNKPDFLGKQALLELEERGSKRYECGLILKDRGIAREGHEVYHKDTLIGSVTSGTLSPTLNRAVAIALVKQPLELGDTVQVQVRQRRLEAEVVKIPFIDPNNL